MSLPAVNTDAAMAAVNDFGNVVTGGRSRASQEATFAAYDDAKQAIVRTAQEYALAVLEPLRRLCAESPWTCLARDVPDALPLEMCLIHRAIAELTEKLESA